VSATTPDAVPGSAAVRPRTRKRTRERLVVGALLLCATVSVLTTFGIVVALLEGTIEFFAEVSPVDFLTGTEWTVGFRNASYGVLALVSNTIAVAFCASLIGLPVGLAAAIFLSEYSGERLRKVLKPILELLAGVPTVVFGYFALTWVTPHLKDFLDARVFNALAPSIVIGIMIIPLVSSLSEDAMRAVPRSLREGGYGVGATKFHVATRIVVPAALSGIVASFILAVSRAVGETMVLVIAAGATPQFSWHPLEPIQTMAAYIAQISQGDTPTGSIEYKTIFAVGMTLFVMTLLLNMLAGWFVRRFRQEYS
jgi:phosphate transport system permease protein